MLAEIEATWESPHASLLVKEFSNVAAFRREAERPHTPHSELTPSVRGGEEDGGDAPPGDGEEEPEFINKPRSALVEGINVQRWLLKHAKPGTARGLNKPRLTYAERRELRSIFDALDADMSGTLDKDEFRAALVGKPIISFEASRAGLAKRENEEEEERRTCVWGRRRG